MLEHRPKHASIALAFKLVTMLPVLLHQLGNTVTAIRSMVPCASELIPARHVVFSRACGAALTTLNNFEKTFEIDAATMLT